jgi:hypothetical protein
MLRIVSVSIGSSSRDKQTKSEFLGQSVEMERVGTDGDLNKAARLIAELDGKVDAIGLGGIDLYLFAGKRRFQIREAKKLARAAKQTPVVDGSGLKITLERQLVDDLAENFPGKPLKESRALMVSGADRWGMAEGVAAHAAQVVIGDLMFGLGIPIPLRSIRALERVARFAAPVVAQLPFKLLYPTGDKQKENKPKYQDFFNWADWYCGDFHYIRRNLPEQLGGKVILTNTTTADDRALLTGRGLSYLVTTTPVIDGRSFGMNVLEGLIVALIRQAGDIPSPPNIAIFVNKLGLTPNIDRLN